MKPFDPLSVDFLSYLPMVAANDVNGLNTAQKQYGSSWKQRGGVGAFMMLARKWDRIEKRLAEKPKQLEAQNAEEWGTSSDRYDIFQHLRADERSEGLIDDIRDLRRYLMLVEAEAMAQEITCAVTIHRDNENGTTPPEFQMTPNEISARVHQTGKNPEAIAVNASTPGG